MILHLIEDSVISDRIINNFEEVIPGRNLYLCFYGDGVKYVHRRDCVFFYKSGDIIKETLDQYNIDKVVIHYLSRQKIEFVDNYIDNSIPIYWIMWGGDFYNNILTYHGHNIYYEPYYVGWRYYIVHFLSNVLKVKCLRNRIGKKTLSFINRRVRFFVSNIDYDLFRSCFHQYVDGVQIKGFFYYPIDSIVENNLIVSSRQKTSIIIGNSASVSNNHSYAFKFIERLNLGEKKIIVPLSYGGTEKYKAHVIQKGEIIWGQYFSPILDFIPLEDYNRLLSTSAICIYANWRQEAVGNILTVLYLGAKVFLSEKNPLFSWFRQLGLVIFSLERIDQEQVDSAFSENTIRYNQEIILKYYNKQALNKAISNIWG